MPQTFRVFVSSTFMDFKSERDALQDKGGPFSRLHALCAANGCRFQAIDLRWGVSEEASLDQKTMQICLEEIQRCQELSPRPNFLIFLGSRYGWQPLPHEIPLTFFNELMSVLNDKQSKKFAEWYDRDDNAVPPMYCLKPRQGRYADTAVWNRKESELRTILRLAIHRSNLSEGEHLEYLASATENEIIHGAMTVPDAKDHVFAFFRNAVNGMLDMENRASSDCSNHEDHAEDRFRLEDLKHRLRALLPGNVNEYEAQIDENGQITTGHIRRLCEDVYQRLAGVILSEIAQMEKISSLDMEISTQSTFSRELTENFIGRSDYLKRIKSYLHSDDKNIFSVLGEGGSGKSALMAFSALRHMELNSQALVVSRHIGTTPESSDIYMLLDGLCRQISEAFGVNHPLPSDFEDLVAEFEGLLGSTRDLKPLIIFIDGLDQLSFSRNAQDLSWLPDKLPANSKIVVSALSYSNAHKALLRRSIPAPNLLRLDVMPAKESEALLSRLLKMAKRSLNDSQLNEVLSKVKQNGLPLYLKLVFDVARRWKSYDSTPDLPSGINGMVDYLLSLLEDDAQHGLTLVSRSLGYLAAAKNGLAEDELLELLSNDAQVFSEFLRRFPKSPHTKERRLPFVIWSRVYWDLKSYLTERSVDHSIVLAFFHRQIKESIEKRYLSEGVDKGFHQVLARYFSEQPYGDQRDLGNAPNYRKVAEMPFHLMKAGLWSELEATLDDFSFSMTKCRAEMLHELRIDFENARSLPLPQRERISSWADFLNQNMNFLLRGTDQWPTHKILLQLAVESGDDCPVTQSAERWLEAGKCDFYWLRALYRPKSQTIKTCIAVLPQDNYDWVKGVVELQENEFISWSNDGFKWWSGEGVLLGDFECHCDGLYDLGNRRILSWCAGHPPQIWDLTTGDMRALEDPWEGATRLSDKRIVVWSQNNNITLRCANTGENTDLIGFHGSMISGIAELGDRKVLVWSQSGLLSIVSLEDNSAGIIRSFQVEPFESLHILWDDVLLLCEKDGGVLSIKLRTYHLDFGYDHSSTFEFLLLKRVIQIDERTLLLVASGEFDLALWDLKDGSFRPLPSQSFGVYDVVRLRDHRNVLLCTDNKLRVYDPRMNGFEEIIGSHPTGFLTGFLELSEGRAVSWAKGDNLRLWRLHSQEVASETPFHKGGVHQVIRLSDRKLASIGISGNTILCWDEKGGHCASSMTSGAKISGIVPLANGMIFSWGHSADFQDANMSIWDANNGQSVYRLERVPFLVLSAFELRYDAVLLYCNDNTFRIWEYRDEKNNTLLDVGSLQFTQAKLVGDGAIVWWLSEETSTTIGFLQVYHDGFMSMEQTTAPKCDIIDSVLFQNKYVLCRLPESRLLMWKHSSKEIAHLSDSDLTGALWKDCRMTVEQLFPGDPSNSNWITKQLPKRSLKATHENKLLSMTRDGCSCCVMDATNVLSEIGAPTWWQSNDYYENQVWSYVESQSKERRPSIRWHGDRVKTHFFNPDGRLIVSNNGRVLVLKLFFGRRPVLWSQFSTKENELC